MNIILKKQLIIIKKLPIDLGCASVNRNSWGSDPKSLGVIRFAITLETSHYLFNIAEIHCVLCIVDLGLGLTL